MRNIIFLFILFLSFELSFAQVKKQDSNPFGMTSIMDVQLQTKRDSLLRFDGFLQLVSDKNPAINQYKSVIKQADARVQSSAGGFDPKLYSELSKKQFDSKTYYQKWETGIEYKTPSPFTFIAGFQENDGQFLNPENNTGKNRLWHMGVQMDLGRGLLTDEQRTRYDVSLSKQKYIQSDIAEQLNSFYLETSTVYWKWAESYSIWDLYKTMHQLAVERKKGLVTGFERGDRSAADTLEAHVLVRQRWLQMQEAFLKFNETQLKIEAYSNQINLTPFFPESHSLNDLTQLNADDIELKQLIDNHPIRKQYAAKIDANKSELKLKWEQIRPELKLYYNYLSNSNQLQFEIGEQATMGFKFSLPLFLRKERGGIQEYKAKIKEAESALEWAELKLNAALEQEIVGVNTQLQLYLNNKSYAEELLQLLQYEKQLFDIGESSLFIVNQREYQYALAEINTIKSYSAYKIQLERWKAQNGTAYKQFVGF